jgi:hypothetical protein
VVRAYVEKVTGMSASQTTRLIRGSLDQGVVRVAPYQRHSFQARYTAEDIALLAEVDRVHERLSGPATRRILEREYEPFGQQPYERLAQISVSHLYNLRASARYRNQAAVFEPTPSSAIAIGERRRPDPRGRPGYLRVDMVHQGDWGGASRQRDSKSWCLSRPRRVIPNIIAQATPTKCELELVSFCSQIVRFRSRTPVKCSSNCYSCIRI